MVINSQNKLNYNQLIKELNDLKEKENSEFYYKFFRIKEHNLDDKFLGIKVPILRKLAKQSQLTDDEILKLLQSNIHDHKIIALVLLIAKYSKSDNNKQTIYNLYLNNLKHINNWDLIDISSPHIIGDYTYNHKEKEDVIYKLAKSDNIWENRISLLTIFTYIRKQDYKFPLEIIDLNITNEHDLVQKPVGWMLREIGKRDENLLIKYLSKNIDLISGISLSYATEKLDKEIKEELKTKRRYNLK